jgi:hypothetical protein
MKNPTYLDKTIVLTVKDVNIMTGQLQREGSFRSLRYSKLHNSLI